MFTRPQGTFEAKPIPQWGTSAIAFVQLDQSWRDDPALKRLFAEALVKHSTPFDAALAVFGADTQAALWASVHWAADPIVQAVLKDVKAVKKILDKDALCNKLSDICDEKSPQGYYLIEPKDRIACLKLYAEIQGYIGKVEAATFNNFANNNLKVVFVKPDNDHQKIKTVKPLDDQFVTDELLEPTIIENDEEILETNFKPLPKLKIV